MTKPAQMSLGLIGGAAAVTSSYVPPLDRGEKHLIMKLCDSGGKIHLDRESFWHPAWFNLSTWGLIKWEKINRTVAAVSLTELGKLAILQLKTTAPRR